MSNPTNKHNLGPKKFQISVLWDLFMVLVVLLNLALIVFDMTYLWLRPYYFQNFPKVLELYDKPILGIEPHRVTEKYLKLVKELEYLNQLKEKNFLQEEYQKSIQSVIQILSSFNIEEEKLEKEKVEFLSKLTLNPPIERITINEDELIDDITDYLLHKHLDTLNDQLTQEWSKIQLYKRVQTNQGWTNEKDRILTKMDIQIATIVETNPFRDSGQTYRLEKIKTFVKSRYDSVKNKKLDKEYRAIVQESLKKSEVPSTVVAFAYFWRSPDNSLEEKIHIFRENLELEFALNYFRHVDKNGKPVDNYLMLDAPFWIFFFLEFCISWFLAVKNKKYMAWFLYPIYHWYDILSLIPLVQFRVFRLFRLYKIFLILKSSRILPVGDDIISRVIRYYSLIIKEELSDMVTIQILTEAQEEIRSGGSIQILTNALDTHREDIKKVVIKKILDTSKNSQLNQLVEEITFQLFSGIQNKLRPFGLLPLGLKNQLSREVSKILNSAISSTTRNLVEDPNNREVVEKLVDYIINEFEELAKDPEVNKVNTDITIELLENIKKSVARKKWLDLKI